MPVKFSGTGGKIITIFFILIIVPLAVYGVYRQQQNNSVVLDELTNDVVNPYVALVKEGKWEDAYNTYTSDRFKEKHSLERFELAQENNVGQYGFIVEVRPNGAGLVDEQYNTKRGWYHQMRLEYTGNAASETIAYDFVWDNDREAYLIDESYEVTGTGVSNRSNDNNILVPKVY